MEFSCPWCAWLGCRGFTRAFSEVPGFKNTNNIQRKEEHEAQSIVESEGFQKLARLNEKTPSEGQNCGILGGQDIHLENPKGCGDDVLS